MEFVRLTPASAKSDRNEDGFLVVRGALDAGTVERVSDAIDRLAAVFLNKPIVSNRPEYNQLDLRPGLLSYNGSSDLWLTRSLSLLWYNCWGAISICIQRRSFAKDRRIRVCQRFVAGGTAIFASPATWGM